METTRGEFAWDVLLGVVVIIAIPLTVYHVDQPLYAQALAPSTCACRKI